MCRGHLYLAAFAVLCLQWLPVAEPIQTDGGSGEERLIGWRGDSYRPNRPVRQTFVSSISWKPRAFVIRNFLSDLEAKHVADQAAISMARSTVVADNGTSVLDDYRTSYGTFISRYKTPVIAAIEDRVSMLTRVPAVYQEDMQVLRYGLGQYYHRHTDSLENDSPRLATVLLYLSDPELGGETAFPQAVGGWTDPAMAQAFGPFSDCVQGNVAFKPKRGDALLFWSIKPDGKTEDPFSEHEGCPVIKGVKWTATIWVHTQPFRPEEWDPSKKTFRRGVPDDDPGICRDVHPECKKWQGQAECEKNPGYMLGDQNQVGHCRLSCGACEACAPSDRGCYNRNRAKLGYLEYHPEELGLPYGGLAANAYDDGTL